MLCPHCQTPVFRRSPDGGRLKMRTNVLVIRKSEGSVVVETNCAHCRKAILLPLALVEGPFEIRKAEQPRLIVRRA